MALMFFILDVCVCVCVCVEVETALTVTCLLSDLMSVMSSGK